MLRILRMRWSVGFGNPLSVHALPRSDRLSTGLGGCVMGLRRGAGAVHPMPGAICLMKGPVDFRVERRESLNAPREGSRGGIAGECASPVQEEMREVGRAVR